MSAVFRRTSDFFNHYGSRHGSVDSTKSETPDPNAPKMKSPEAEAPIEGSSAKDQHSKRRRWSLRPEEDEETRERRKSQQLEKDRAEFAATRRYVRARRKSSGAGIGFEGGWQG